MSNQTFYQFGGRAQHPVHVDFHGHDPVSNGIAFEDYARMTTQQHKLARGRRGTAPPWVFSDSKLRDVIVGCVEARAYMSGIRYHKAEGTDAARLASAQRKIAENQRPTLVARIDELCAKHMAAKRAGDVALAKQLAQKVEETDTQLRMIDNPAKYYVGVAYHYWRCGLDSVATGQQLGLKPPHVRCLLWRMGKVAGQLGHGPAKHNRLRNNRGRGPRKRVVAPAVELSMDLLHIAKQIIETDRRQKISAALTGRARPEDVRQKIAAACKGRFITAAARQKLSVACLEAAERRGTNLIPYRERRPLAVKMFRAGAKRIEIAAALGWGKSGRNQNGTGMVKRLLIQAGLLTT